MKLSVSITTKECNTRKLYFNSLFPFLSGPSLWNERIQLNPAITGVKGLTNFYPYVDFCHFNYGIKRKRHVGVRSKHSRVCEFDMRKLYVKFQLANSPCMSVYTFLMKITICFFLVACTRLYIPLGPSVGPSVRHTLLFLALPPLPTRTRLR